MTADENLCAGRKVYDRPPGWHLLTPEERRASDAAEDLNSRIGAEAAKRDICPFCLRPNTVCAWAGGAGDCDSGNPPIGEAEAVAKLWRYERG